MIRYKTTLAKLEQEAEKEKPGWLKKAASCTSKCRKAKKYIDQGSIWGEVKGAYMRLQHNKCVYCERKLAARERVNADGTLEMIGPGSVEHDVEHFRPKSSVKEWPTAKITKDRKIGYNFSVGKDSSTGYYLLAYHLQNYATSCKSCNTPLKSNYFPVLSKRNTNVAVPSDAAGEKALLLYPIGGAEADDPEEFITFDAWLPRPVKKTGDTHWRAAVTIDFFELATREELLRERCEAIVAMYIAYQSRALPAMKDLAEKNLDYYQSAQHAHTNCCRAFYALLASDLARAATVATDAQAFLDSES